ncbi:cobaltochelatase subunit CobN [Hylemonella sp. W303a]|uniref:cobaltochelatase subunit CobN n=1 Tax=Hylemonella sp. W303a TaxID=3389873 RepID=UPI00396B2CC2
MSPPLDLGAWRRRAILVLSLPLMLLAGAAQAGERIALLSTRIVLEHRYKLMEADARQAGLELAWTQVDVEGEAGVRRVLEDARLVLIDSHRAEDRAVIERLAGEFLRQRALPSVSVNNTPLSPTGQRGIGLPEDQARRIHAYYVSGTAPNRAALFQYLAAFARGGDLAAVPAPRPLPASAIYHPRHPDRLITDLPAYLAWWQQTNGRSWRDRPVIAMEMASTYVAESQNRMLDETVQALEAAGALPLLFYRATRLSRERPPSGAPVQVPEPLITHEGRTLPHVLLVNTFLGIAPDQRRAWHQSLGIPAINVLAYREGTRADYLRDPAGVSSFSLPFTLTNAEYIGLQDPVVLTSNEGGELVPMPEQMQLLVGKATRLAQLQMKANADKRVALFFWNHPPGERNQGASNLNVPRSIAQVVTHLRAEGYDFASVNEQTVINTVARMLRPSYRAGTLPELMNTVHWDFLPLAEYQRWYAQLPEPVRQPIEAYWGAPEKSAWIARRQGVTGFVIPRLELKHLVVLPQPSRSESAASGKDESQLFHDTKVPVHHAYLATYLWVREHFQADAIVHFGTHGTQEWTPGKERGLWAHDEPNLLVGNTPVVYPYIVDNIGEALHAKRRGRGVIVSHQTPPFAPAGLTADFVRINDLIREYQSLDDGLVKDNNRRLIIEQAVRMNIHQDMRWKVADLEREFPRFLREIEDYLEELGTGMQPLGLHTLGQTAEAPHRVSTVMQMLGQPLLDALRVKEGSFKTDYRQLQLSRPYRFVQDHVLDARAVDSWSDPRLSALAERGREHLQNLEAGVELQALSQALSARWVDPSYGGDPIRNPDALPTGRNLYGFDPSRIPTRAAYEAGQQALQQLVADYRRQHGQSPRKLAFTLWSTETLRHLGMLESQILYALGVRPRWDEGGRVIGLEVIPAQALGRPRIDTVISLTGLYRDQFPNVMERLNEAVTMVAALDEDAQQNPVRAQTERVRQHLLAQGIAETDARDYALTRLYGNESGDYGTGLTEATMATERWNEDDGKLAGLYLARMSWAYGPDPARWSRKLSDAQGREVNVYAEQLRGTSAAVLSRSSQLRGLLDTDHPFEYLGGLALAVRQLDGASPALYVANLRDANRARLERAETFIAKELRSIYHHPRWIAEMRQEGYAGTLQLLNTVNNFWGWQVMDRQTVRADQWQEFHEVYVRDRHRLGLRPWFERHNPDALAQVVERMLEAVRKDYWQADARTVRELVEVYQQLRQGHDIRSSNATFQAYVAELAAGYGLGRTTTARRATAASPPSAAAPTPEPTVRGQELREVPQAAQQALEELVWIYALLIGLVVLGGVGYQAWRTRRISF